MPKRPSCVSQLSGTNDALRINPSVFYQNRASHDVTIYWPNRRTRHDRFVSENPTSRGQPDKLYLPSLNIQADLGPVQLISTTAYFHRDEAERLRRHSCTTWATTSSQIPSFGLDPTYFRCSMGRASTFRPDSKTTVACHGHERAAQFQPELRLQSTDPAARLTWTVGAYYSQNRQLSLEEIHDPMADQFFGQIFGDTISDYFGVSSTPMAAPTCRWAIPISTAS